MPKRDNEALRISIATLSPLIQVRTSETARFVTWFNEQYGSNKRISVKVWRSTLGEKDIADYVSLWSQYDEAALRPADTASAHRFLMNVLGRNCPISKDRATRSLIEYILVLGAPPLLNGRDPQITQRLLDLAEQAHQSKSTNKVMIFVTPDFMYPPGMDRMFKAHTFDPPSLEDITEGLRKTFSQEQIRKAIPSVPDIDECARVLHGMASYEISAAVYTSLARHHQVTPETLMDAKREAIDRNPLLELVEPDLTFREVGGMENLKGYLRDRRGTWSQEAKDFGIERFRGVLQVGLPGNGKSLICKAVAAEYGLPLVQFDPARLYNSRVGSSESNMYSALKMLETMSPCIVWVDEIEKALAGLASSSASDGGTASRVIGIFLNWLQESKKDVIFMATANDITTLPPELLRRFDDIFFVGLPNEAQREEIWRIHISAKGRDASAYDIDELVRVSVDRSGSEIETAVNSALVEAFADGKRKLTTADMVKAIAEKPPLLVTMRDQLQSIINWVGKDPETGRGVRARFAHDVDTGPVMNIT